MAISNEKDLESVIFSQVDWIVCLAIIKRRNPKLLALKKAVTYGTGTGLKSRDIYSLIPNGLAHLKANKPLLIQLDVVYQYILRFKKVSVNIDIIRSLSEDVSVQDITRWVLPNYKSVIAILSVGNDISQRKALVRLTSCLQLLLSSFCCCKLQDPCRFVLEYTLVKFIRNDILPNKTKNSKIIQRFHPKEELSIKKSKLLKLHCKLLNLILNLKLRTALSSTAERKDVEVKQFFQIISDFCMYLESLIHAFIGQSSSKSLNAQEKGSAFIQHYLARLKKLPDRYVKDILLIITENDDGLQEKIDCLKMVIKQLLGVLDAVLWSLLDDYVIKHEGHIISLKNQRMNLQSSLLVAADLDLISEFRLISWPHWAICSH